MRIAVFALLVGCSSCRTTAPADRWRDDAPRAECTDACACAESNLRAVCPELVSDDFDEWCRAMLDSGVPLCPIKLASAANCEEVNRVCR